MVPYLHAGSVQPSPWPLASSRLSTLNVYLLLATLVRRCPWVRPGTAVITHPAEDCSARVPCSHSRPTSVFRLLRPDPASRVAGPPFSLPGSGSSTPLLWHAGSGSKLCSPCTLRPSPSCASHQSNPPARVQYFWKFPTTAETGPPSALCSTSRRALPATIAPMVSRCRAPEARSAPVGVVPRPTSHSVLLAHSSQGLHRCRACPLQLASSRRTLAPQCRVRAHAVLCAMSLVSQGPARCVLLVTSAWRARAQQTSLILELQSGLYLVLSAPTVAPESLRTGRSQTTSPLRRRVSRASCASPVQSRRRAPDPAPLGTTAHLASSSHAQAAPTAPAWPIPNQSRASPVSTSRSSVSPRARNARSVRSVRVSRENFQNYVPRVLCATRLVCRFRRSDAQPDTSVWRTLSRQTRSARWT